MSGRRVDGQSPLGSTDMVDGEVTFSGAVVPSGFYGQSLPSTLKVG